MINANNGNILQVFLNIYWLEIVILISFLVLGFILEQKFNFRKPREWFLAFNGLIFQRTLSVLAYYVPYLDAVNTHVPLISEFHPFIVRLFLPNFIVDSIEFIQQIPFLQFFYLLFGYGILIRYKIPSDRFVRFNIMYGIMIISFQGIVNEAFIGITDFFIKDAYTKSEAALFCFFMWIIIIIPCFIRAFLGKYDGNPFMREAVEVHLGRDGPDFIWWDRTRKDKSPRKPKL